ncbi:MAG: hypothetical protein K0R98_1672 [Rickettsiaceae bacterium]|jgi:FkbM family methyltransferase|nr:hypothetical protein [Rickettsiaceae bacterium]
MKEKLAIWISQKRNIPYRFRKSLIKRTCPKILSDYDFEINYYGMKYKGNTRDGKDRSFFLFGGPEKYILSFMRDYRLITKNDNFVFVDVGANIGGHSLFMSKYASHVYAFEPNKSLCDLMFDKLQSNAIKNITLNRIGLGNSNEKAAFYADKQDRQSSGSFLKEHAKSNVYLDDFVIKRGDEVLQRIEKVDLIKVDVSGCERSVIEGLKSTIEKSRPLVIVDISTTTRTTIGSRDDFESIFPKSYVFYKFTATSRENDKYKLVPYNYAEDFADAEVVAIAKEKILHLGNRLRNR